MVPVIRRSVVVVSSTASSSTSPLAAVWSSEAFISSIEAAVRLTESASTSALRARLAICAAISTIVEEVSSVALLWLSAPLAMWSAAAEISSAEPATFCVVSRMREMMRRKLCTMVCIASSSWPVSSLPRTCTWVVEVAAGDAVGGLHRHRQRAGDAVGEEVEDHRADDEGDQQGEQADDHAVAHVLR